jgi:hypothetical protein
MLADADAPRGRGREEETPARAGDERLLDRERSDGQPKVRPSLLGLLGPVQGRQVKVAVSCTGSADLPSMLV